MIAEMNGSVKRMSETSYTVIHSQVMARRMSTLPKLARIAHVLTMCI
jgi:hypothetical protein